MISLKETDKTKAQDWFIENLDINPDNKKMVVEKINLLLKKSSLSITEKDLPTLLA